MTLSVHLSLQGLCPDLFSLAQSSTARASNGKKFAASEPRVGFTTRFKCAQTCYSLPWASKVYRFSCFLYLTMSTKLLLLSPVLKDKACVTWPNDTEVVTSFSSHSSSRENDDQTGNGGESLLGIIKKNENQAVNIAIVINRFNQIWTIWWFGTVCIE